MTRGKCDEYGLFAAVKAGLHTFSIMARRTGRTTRMIERIKDGDILICSTSEVEVAFSRHGIIPAPLRRISSGNSGDG